MGRPLRMFEPDGLYFITGRCLQARFLLRPSPETNGIVGGVLARAASRFEVDLYGFVFTSNHFHLLLGARRCNIPAFMQYLRGNIAKKLGRAIDWPGKFWDRRYDAEPVLDDEAAIGRLRYILAHGVKEGLVTKVDEWPGLSCVQELRDGASRSFAWPGSDVADDTAHVSLSLAVLPCWSTHDVVEQRRLVAELVASVEAQALSERGSQPLGALLVEAQHPHHRPARPKRTRRPLCHASTSEARLAYLAKYQAFVEAFRAAVVRPGVRAGATQGCEPALKLPLYAYGPPATRPVLRAA